MPLLRWSLRLLPAGLFAGVWLCAGVYLYLSPGLPDVETLRDVRLQTPMRVYSLDGELMGQFGEQKRNPLRYEQIPQTFIDALLAAEDDGFFSHAGIDFMGLLRAVSELLLTGKKGSGGSTLTMQVARNYFLSLERTFIRKFNEILLAVEIERALSKEEILELYVNRVFLGHRAYGFEAAAQTYYGKSLMDLNLAQHAMLAGIPKAPSRNNPLSGPEAGLARRDWILGRMRLLGFIDQKSYQAALEQPLTASSHGASISLDAFYAAEMARRQMVERFGMAAYNDGYRVFTTIDSRLQRVARAAVVNGLRTYDGRHGYRGPEAHLEGDASTPGTRESWREVVADVPPVAGLLPAVVTEVRPGGVSAVLGDNRTIYIAFEDGIADARPYLDENRRGAAPASPGEVLTPGDVIRVEAIGDGRWSLAQVPEAQAALVSLDAGDGAIRSLVGGIGANASKFNRATQARRQPGSNFKPFLYAAALEAGFTAASLINDAPVVMEDSSLEGAWRPENDGGRFYGPTRLRWALTKSRNLVSIRLLQQLGGDRLRAYARRLGLDTSEFSPGLSQALGTHTMTPLDLAGAYAILANGGFRVEPYLIARIEDSNGTVLDTAAPARACPACEKAPAPNGDDDALPPQGAGDAPATGRLAPRVMEPRVNFIIHSMLQDVITSGTGRRARVLNREDLAGKTGTTNGPMDAWFSGYGDGVVTTTWVGFDGYTPLGRREFGGTAALPIWIEFMREALDGVADTPRSVPSGVVYVRIDPNTGEAAGADASDAIFEYFREEYAPRADGTTTAPYGTGRAADDLIKDIF